MPLTEKEHYQRYRDTYTKYRETHREERLEQRKQYYIQNREKELARIQEWRNANNERLTTMIHCNCGGHYQLRSKLKHERTKKHLRNLQALKEQD